MMPAQWAIARFRRDLTLGALLRITLGAAVVAWLVMRLFITNPLGDVAALVAGIGASWITLSYHSIKGSRLAAGSPSLIAAGHFEAAEDQIQKALRSFSLFRGSKLLSLHHLAVLRHAQRRWQDSAELSGALLRQRLGNLHSVAQQSRLILTDSLLEIGDIRGAHAAMTPLYDQRLTLAEAMNLLTVQLDYLWRVHAFEAMLAGLETKVQLAELMPVEQAAKTQALLALAAHRLGRAEWSVWLRRRAELLTNRDELMASRPVLAELWPSTASPEVSPGGIT